MKAALELGARVQGGYDLLVSSGTQRSTQTIACLLAARGERVENGLVIEHGLRSEVEDRWRDAYGKAGSGELEGLEAADPELVAQDGAVAVYRPAWQPSASTKSGRRRASQASSGRRKREMSRPGIPSLP